MRFDAINTLLLALVLGCSGENSVVIDGGADSGIDGGGTDSGATDSSATDSSDSGTVDSGAGDTPQPDAGTDGEASDAGADVPDAGPPSECDPGCAADETCLGEACSCVRQVDGSSYIRSNGTVVNHTGIPAVVTVGDGTVELTDVEQLTDGSQTTCALRGDGSVYCWAKGTSSNAFGDLGNGTLGGTTIANRAAPVLIAPETDGGVPTPLTGMAHLSGQSDSRCYINPTCAIRESDGALFCWGVDNAAGGTGSIYTEGTVGPRPFATQIMASATTPLLNVAQVALGLRHACATTTAGDVLCWGMNVGGPLGLGDQVQRLYPTEVTLPTGVQGDEIGAGGDFTCIRSVETVYCWGSSGAGELGVGDPAAVHDGCSNFCRLTPIQVVSTGGVPLGDVQRLEVNYQGGCVKKSDHTLHCWGEGITNEASPLMHSGAPVTNVVQFTSCSTNTITTAIRYITRDDTYYRGMVETEPLCAE